MATCIELYGYDDERDTGYCFHCGKQFTDAERTIAVHGAVRHGIREFYSCAECFQRRFMRSTKIEITQAKQ